MRRLRRGCCKQLCFYYEKNKGHLKGNKRGSIVVSNMLPRFYSPKSFFKFQVTASERQFLCRTNFACAINVRYFVLEESQFMPTSPDCLFLFKKRKGGEILPTQGWEFEHRLEPRGVRIVWLYNRVASILENANGNLVSNLVVLKQNGPGLFLFFLALFSAA